MIVSPVRYTDPEWTRERLLTMPTWTGGGERRERRPKKGPLDHCELSEELQLLLIEEALDLIWSDLALPVVRRSYADWGRTALGAVLGKALAAEMLRRAYVPKTFGDFQSLAQAFSLRN